MFHLILGTVPQQMIGHPQAIRKDHFTGFVDYDRNDRLSLTELCEACRVHCTKQEGDGIMANYIIFFGFTQQGIEGIKDSPERVQDAKQVIQSMGGKVKDFYGVMGMCAISCVHPKGLMGPRPNWPLIARHQFKSTIVGHTGRYPEPQPSNWPSVCENNGGRTRVMNPVQVRMTVVAISSLISCG